MSFEHGLDLLELVRVVVVLRVQLIYLLHLIFQAARVRRLHARVKVRLLLLLHRVQVYVAVLVARPTLSLIGLVGVHFWLGHVVFGKLKGFLSRRHFSHRGLDHSLRQRICVRLHPYLLSVLPLRLFLLLGFLPLIASDIGTKSAQPCVLCLYLHLLEVFEIVALELRRVCGVLRVLAARVLGPYPACVFVWRGNVGDLRDLCGQVGQVFVQETIVFV